MAASSIRTRFDDALARHDAADRGIAFRDSVPTSDRRLTLGRPMAGDPFP